VIKNTAGSNPDEALFNIFSMLRGLIFIMGSGNHFLYNAERFLKNHHGPEIFFSGHGRL
jgi:hypothetical protein